MPLASALASSFAALKVFKALSVVPYPPRVKQPTSFPFLPALEQPSWKRG
jgi:hypothetical protein